MFNGKPALTCHAVVLQPGTAALLQVLQQVDLTRRGFETLAIPKHEPSNVTDGHAKRFQISGTICHHRENVWNELVCFSFFIDSLPGPGERAGTGYSAVTGNVETTMWGKKTFNGL